MSVRFFFVMLSYENVPLSFFLLLLLLFPFLLESYFVGVPCFARLEKRGTVAQLNLAEKLLSFFTLYHSCVFTWVRIQSCIYFSYLFIFETYKYNKVLIPFIQSVYLDS